MRTFPVLLVTGPRQCGKTTFLLHEFGATHRYASFDEPDVRERALSDPRAFLRDLGSPCILDEVQHVPDLLSYVKARVDADRRPGQWVLSGSQSFPLMRGVSESLAGRVAVMRLDPLGVGEAQALPPRSPDEVLARVFGGDGQGDAGQGGDWAGPVDLGDWLLRGGYPELRLDPAVDRRLWLGSYVDTYLARDVRDLLQVGDLGLFQRFLILCASRTGRLVNFADLARDTGVAPTTARRWLSVLEASQVIHLLPAYFENFGRRVTKAPKLVFLDQALAAFLMGLHSRDSILQGPAAGGLAESAVVAEWIKLFRQHGHEPRVFHWSAHGGDEIDLVVEWEGRLHSIEVKATATPTPTHAAPLQRWLALAGDNARGVVACSIAAPFRLSGAVRAVPWHLAFR